MAPKLWCRTAIALPAIAKNMWDQEDVAVQTHSKMLDNERQQLPIIRPQPEHVVAGIATDIEQPTDIQSHQWPAIFEAGERPTRCLRGGPRLQGKTHILSEFRRRTLDRR